MQLTENIEKAIQKSAILHDGQRRKGGKQPPYIIHPFAVAVIVSQYTDDENTIIAGLLHDTIEDTGYMKEEMEHDFGKTVTEIVQGVTEEKERNGEKLPWKTRKISYIETLKKAPEASLMVSAADKIHNLSSMIRDCGELENDMWKIFTPGKNEQLWFYSEVLEVLKKRLNNDVVSEFEAVFQKAKKIF